MTESADIAPFGMEFLYDLAESQSYVIRASMLSNFTLTSHDEDYLLRQPHGNTRI